MTSRSSRPAAVLTSYLYFLWSISCSYIAKNYLELNNIKSQKTAFDNYLPLSWYKFGNLSMIGQSILPQGNLNLILLQNYRLYQNFSRTFFVEGIVLYNMELFFFIIEQLVRKLSRAAFENGRRSKMAVIFEHMENVWVLKLIFHIYRYQYMIMQVFSHILKDY